MMRFLFFRILLPVLLFLVIRSVLKTIFGLHAHSVSKPPQPGPPVHGGGELKKDPVCGTFVSVDASVTKRVNGETVHFCSAACRDKYRAA